MKRDLDQTSAAERKPNGSAIKTIFADDSSFVREGLLRLLKHLPGIELVGIGNNGIEAVELVSMKMPQLVLMDFQMPGLNGLKAACVIRDLAPHVKIIIMTAHDLEKVRASALAHTVDAFLAKQEIASQLPAIIERLFRED
jgi:DNA-binding NarL/FixJ family response regulator